MPETVRKADYFYTMVPDKAGEGARILKVLRDAGVNLRAFSGFPEGRKSQLDFVPVDSAAFLAAAKAAKIKVSRKKTCFLIDGDDRVGAMADAIEKLATAKINVTAVDAVATGGGRYGAILWVKARDVGKAEAVLRARQSERTPGSSPPASTGRAGPSGREPWEPAHWP